MPDIEDGLDSVQRQVLLSLGDRYVRCADVVSDAASYEALVSLAQPFRRRYPLVDGLGNFGSIDPQPVLATLLAHTSLEITLTVDLVALVDGTPLRLTLRELIAHFRRRARSCGRPTRAAGHRGPLRRRP